MKGSVLFAGCFVLLLQDARGQQPRIVQARLEIRSAAGGLEKEFRSLLSGQAEPAWLGYAVPMIPGEHNMCCFNTAYCCGGCQLEGKQSGSLQTGKGDRVRLEGPRHLFILFRAEQTRVEKMRTFTEDCELDAGGLPFFWLTDVRPSESVALLSSFAAAEGDAKEGRRLADSTVAAIAFHNDAAADRALEGFVAASQPESLRERTSFWLGNARGHRGYELLRRMLREDPSPKVREKAVFALTQSREPEAVATIIETARNDAIAHVRGQALFWLAQKAGAKAAGAITDAIEKDPETEVKKKAVFALSQLPADEGVPKLIEVARANRNPEVRKQAIFWLGQSRDPRALAFFEEVLLRGPR